MALVLHEHDVAQLVTIHDALAAVERAFRQQADGAGPLIPRQRVLLPRGVMHLIRESRYFIVPLRRKNATMTC